MSLYKIKNNSRRTYDILVVMFGYFFQDFIASRKAWMKYFDEFFHHVLSFTLIYTIYQKDIEDFIPYGTLLELSSVFLHSMWILRELGMEKTKLTKFVQIGFVVIFFIHRMFVFPYHLYLAYEDDKKTKRFGYIIQLSLLLHGMNVFWMIKIFNNLYQMIKNKEF